MCLSVLAMQVFLHTYATDGIRPALAREVLASCSQASFDAAIGDGQAQVIVAEHRGHMIGFAHVRPAGRLDPRPDEVQAELVRLYVQERFTGAQVGTRLLAEAENRAAAAGATLLRLNAWAHNRRALAFYARHGYADFGPTCFTFEGESHENRLLMKPLRPNSRAV